MMMHNAENDATEYRVAYWSKDHGRWFSHTAQSVTDSPRIAAIWLEQARHRGPFGEPTEAFIEARTVGPWTRVIPPEKGDDDA